MPTPGNGRFSPPDDIGRLGAADLAEAIRDRTYSVAEVVKSVLSRIDKVNSHVNAIVSLRDREELLREADDADRRLAGGEGKGLLFGVPMAVKDLAQTKGLRTTFGSPIFANNVPDVDDFFVERLRSAGAIIIGKTNVPEFGLGSNTYNPVFGPTLNAFDHGLSAGGSSGGAAVALALHMLPVADGSDMGGSLRNPAAYNNVYGFRPSQGRVAAGPQPEAFVTQMGVEGPMGRSVRDMALLLEVQSGYDVRSPLSLDGDTDFLDALRPEAEGVRIAWLGDLGGHLAMELGILDLCSAALKTLEGAGATVEPFVPAFDFESLWQAFVTLRHFTSGSALKVHYDDPDRRHMLKPEAIFEVEGGLDLLAAKIHAASAVRTAWFRHVVGLFDRFDFLAVPTAQVFPFPIDRHWPAEIAGRKMDSYHRWMEVCALATMAGCPAVNVPVGFDDTGRPMGMQLIGRPRGDLAVLTLAAAYEEVTPYGVR
ncbi:amidase [Aquibium oceanicum]|uniref:Indoleacetamide hydrolase n=1 Tax=Aquibium oceanicum TaxID=1670800 RepID=A0A1L3SYW4_9HYPH|nr:amidase [Aquibium oceanicum]APH74606.1 amidase [Aquibium oceanicum]